MTKLFPVSKFIISGHSMQPFLNPGQYVLIFNWAYLWSNPKIGDVVIFKKNNRVYIKRIQKINGLEVYVVGDNKADSEDSRKFGSINKKEIIGKVFYCFQ